MIMLGIFAIVWLVAGLAVCLSRPRHPNNVYILTKMLGKAQWILGIKVRCKDFPEARALMPAILVGNHQTNWDIILLANLLQPGVVCVGKKSLIFAPIFGILFFLSGNILIDRNNHSKTGSQFVEIVRKIKKKSLSIWMFPEGHRSGGKGMLQFKSGAVHTAMLAKVPIIPFVASSYVDQIKLNRWNNGEIILEMLPPVSFKDAQRGDLKTINKELRQNMINKIKELDKVAVRPIGTKLPTYDD